MPTTMSAARRCAQIRSLQKNDPEIHVTHIRDLRRYPTPTIRDDWKMPTGEHCGVPRFPTSYNDGGEISLHLECNRCGDVVEIHDWPFIERFCNMDDLNKLGFFEQ